MARYTSTTTNSNIHQLPASGKSNSSRIKLSDRFTWLTSAILLIAWVIVAGANLALRNLWNDIPASPSGLSWSYTPLLSAAALVVCGGVIAWLFYTLGTQGLRKQAALERHYRQIVEEACQGTLHTLNSVLDLRDDGTYGHSQRVAGFSVAIGKRLGLNKYELQSLAWGSLLHDLGKIGIRDEIMLKAGPLTEDERSQMKQHVIIGAQLVKSIPFLANTADLVRHHHEWYNGAGYPDRIQGETIPMQARIFAVADAYDAMTSARPYRPVPLSSTQAIKEIKTASGSQFCPKVVEAFLQVTNDELAEIRNHSFLTLVDPKLLFLYEIESNPRDIFYQDTLTNTRNRAAWGLKRAQLASKQGKDLGILVFIDLDGFKDVNDSHGHLVGDRVLADIGDRLVHINCESYRVGGDEFLLWFPPETSPDQIHNHMSSFVDNFSEDWQYLKCGLSVSWGLAVASGETKYLDQLLYEADRAMYAKKGIGGRSKFPLESMQSTIIR